MSEKLLTPIEIGLTAAIVAIEGNEPLILTASGSDDDKLAGLPLGPFDAVSPRTFEIGLRWREARPGTIERDIFPELTRWAAGNEQPDTARALSRKDRIRLYFGIEGAHWDEATAIAQLRAKLKYRPVVFELLPAEFTLTELQRTVEAIPGRHLHKQNFRRLVEAGAPVEPAGVMSTQTGGRPAALFRFRREVLQERPAPGLRVRGRR